MKKKISINLISVIILVVAIVTGIIIHASSSVKNSVVTKTGLESRTYMAEGDEVAAQWDDLSKNKGNMAIYGARWNNERTGLAFDGVDDYVKLGKYTNQTFTNEVTFETNKLDGTQNVLSNINNGGFAILVRNGQIRALISTGTDRVKVLYYNGVIVNTKYTVQVVKDDTEVKMYVNGQLADSVEASMSTVNNEMMIGAKPLGDEAETNFFSGVVYAVRLYDRALTEQELNTNYALVDDLYNSPVSGQVAEDITGYADDALVQLDGRKTERTKVMDLSLRTFVTKINDNEIDQTREPVATVENNSFVYKHRKDSISVFAGDKITLKIRVYNEGEYDGNAEKINVWLPEYLKLAENNDDSYESPNEMYQWEYENDNLITTTYLSNDPRTDKWGNVIEKDNTIQKYGSFIDSKDIELELEVKSGVALNGEQRQCVLAEIAKTTFVEEDSTSNSINNVTTEDLKTYKQMEAESSDENSYIIGYEDDDDFEAVTVYKELDAQIELNKIGMSSNENIGGGQIRVTKLDEDRRTLKVLNKATSEEMTADTEGYINVPEDGLILSISPMAKGDSAKILIEEKTAPDGYKKVLENVTIEITVGADGNPVGKVLSVIEKAYDDNGNETTKTVNGSVHDLATFNNEDENGVATASPEDNNLSLKYKIGLDGEWQDYTGEFEVEENCTIYAQSSDSRYTSATTIHPITNIDKVLPEVDEISVTDRQTWADLGVLENPITAVLTDNASGISGYQVTSTNVEPTRWKSGNKKLSQNINITGIKEGGTYYLWVKDVAGNVNSEVFEVPEAPEIYVAEIVEYDNNPSLVGTQYTTLREAIEMIAANDKAEIKILVNIPNEANTIDQNKDITIDLNAKTIDCLNERDVKGENDTTGKPVFTVDSKLTIVDRNYVELTTGTVRCADEQAVVVNQGGELSLGINDRVVKDREPKLIGDEYGIDNKGILNFYDGIVIAKTAISTNSTPNTPEDYVVSIAEETDVLQNATVKQVTNIEARIGRKTYRLLEEAIEEANTVYGTDGSQVEITIVKDLYKENTIIVDDTKNIKLNLNGHAFTTSAEGPTLVNRGNLEIYDSSKLNGTFDSYFDIPSFNTQTFKECTFDTTEETEYILELSGSNYGRDIDILVDGENVYNLKNAQVPASRSNYSVYLGELQPGHHNVKIVINDSNYSIKSLFNSIRVTNTIGGGRIYSTTSEAVVNEAARTENDKMPLSNYVDIGYDAYFERVDNSLVPTNLDLNYSIAKSYYVIDLTDKQEDELFYIKGNVEYTLKDSSYRYSNMGNRNYGDYFYIAIKNNNNVTDYIPTNTYASDASLEEMNVEDALYLYSQAFTSSNKPDLVGNEDFRTIFLRGGNKYYLHLAYVNNSPASSDKNLKISNLELIDYSKRKPSSLKIDSGIFESFVDGGTAFLNSSSSKIEDGVFRALSKTSSSAIGGTAIENAALGNIDIDNFRIEDAYYGIKDESGLEGKITIKNGDISRINQGGPYGGYAISIKGPDKEYEKLVVDNINTSIDVRGNTTYFANFNLENLSAVIKDGTFNRNDFGFTNADVVMNNGAGENVFFDEYSGSSFEMKNGEFNGDKITVNNSTLLILNGTHDDGFITATGENAYATIKDGNYRGKVFTATESANILLEKGDYTCGSMSIGTIYDSGATVKANTNGTIHIKDGTFDNRFFVVGSVSGYSSPVFTNGNIIIDDGSYDKSFFRAMKGSLTINGGTFVSKETYNLIDAYRVAYYYSNNYTRTTTDGNIDITIKGGDFTSLNNTVLYANKDNYNIENATFTGKYGIENFEKGTQEKTTIKNSTFNTTDTAIHGYYNTIEVDGGSYKSTSSNALQILEGNIVLKAGTFESEGWDTIRLATKNTSLVVGEKNIEDNHTISNEPIIKAPKTDAAIRYTDITEEKYFKWYDGAIYGHPDNMLEMGIDEIEVDTEIVGTNIEDDYKKIELKHIDDITSKAVEVISAEDHNELVGKQYVSINKALEELETKCSGKEVTLKALRELDLGNVQTINNVKLSFDNADYKVYAYRNGTFVNNGTLKFINTAGDNHKNYLTRFVNFINNTGSLEICDKVLMETYDKMPTRYQIMNNGSNATLKINDGAIINGNTGGIILYNNSNAENSVIINGEVNVLTFGGTSAIVNNKGYVFIDNAKLTMNSASSGASPTMIVNNADARIVFNDTEIIKDSYSVLLDNNSTKENNIHNCDITINYYRAVGTSINNQGKLTIDGADSSIVRSNTSYNHTFVNNSGDLYVDGIVDYTAAGIGGTGNTYISNSTLGVEGGYYGSLYTSTDGYLEIDNSTFYGNVTVHGDATSEARNALINDSNIHGAINVSSGRALVKGNTVMYQPVTVTSNSEFTLGENDGNVSVGYPFINTPTESSGITVTNSTFNFYDGRVSGKNENLVIGGTVADKPEGYNLKKTNNETTNAYEIFLASDDIFRLTDRDSGNQIGVYKTVESLNTALDTLNVSGHYRLDSLSDIYFVNEDPSLEFKSGLDVTWQLNGKQHRINKDESIINNGTLNIVNNGQMLAATTGANIYNDIASWVITNNGTMSFTNVGVYSKRQETTTDKIINNGTMSVLDGTCLNADYYNGATAIVKNAGAGSMIIDNCHVLNNMIINDSTNNLEIKNNTLVETLANNYDSMIFNQNTGKLTIDNCELKKSDVLNEGTGTVEIKGTDTFVNVRLYNNGTFNINSDNKLNIVGMYVRDGIMNVNQDIQIGNRLETKANSVTNFNKKVTQGGTVYVYDTSVINYNDELTGGSFNIEGSEGEEVNMYKTANVGNINNTGSGKVYAKEITAGNSSNSGAGQVIYDYATLNRVSQAGENETTLTRINGGSVTSGVGISGGKLEINETDATKPTTIGNITIGYYNSNYDTGTIYDRNLVIEINGGKVGTITPNEGNWTNRTNYSIYINGGEVGNSPDTAAIKLTNYFLYKTGRDVITYSTKLIYGKLYIGTDDGTVNNSPKIVGYIEQAANNAIINYYDGTIESTTPCGVQGLVDDIPDNYYMISDYDSTNNKYIVSLKTGAPKYQVNGVNKNTYGEITSALTETNNTIKLLDNVIIKNPLEIPANKNVVLDLNGYGIYNVDGENNYAIINNGNLEIKNTNANSDSAFNAYQMANFIKNNTTGTLKVEGIDFSIVQYPTYQRLYRNNPTTYITCYKSGVEHNCIYNLGTTNVDLKDVNMTNADLNKTTFMKNEATAISNVSMDNVHTSNTKEFYRDTKGYSKVDMDNTSGNEFIGAAKATLTNGSDILHITAVGECKMTDSRAGYVETITDFEMDNSELYNATTSSVTNAKLKNATIKNITIDNLQEENIVNVSGTIELGTSTTNLEVKTINAGTLKNSSSGLVINSSTGYKIDTFINKNDATINRGTFKNITNGVNSGMTDHTLTINDATITDGTGTALMAYESVTINDITIEGDYSKGIHFCGAYRDNLDNRYVRVLGGNIFITGSSAIHLEGGYHKILIIGTKGGGVDSSIPSISGGDYGVRFVDVDAEGYFYDGVIAGGVAPIAGTFTEVETGYHIVVTSDGKEARLSRSANVQNVAMVNGIAYTTFANAYNAAINATESDVTITILGDLSITQQFTIPSTKNITINLNANSMSATMSSAMFKVNDGTLTIEDIVEDDDSSVAIQAKMQNNGGPVVELNGGHLNIGEIGGDATASASPRIIGKNGDLRVTDQTFGVIKHTRGTVTLYVGTLEDLTTSAKLTIRDYHRNQPTVIASNNGKGLKAIKALGNNELSEGAKKLMRYISAPSVSHTPTEWTNQNVTVTMSNSGRLIFNISDRESGMDLALREYIVSINGEDTDYDRAPVIDGDLLQGMLDRQTGNYKQIKKYAYTETNDVIVENIKVFNEGTVGGYASEIVKYLPEGLDYIADNQTNIDNGWSVASTDASTGRVTAIKTNKLAETVVSADSNNNTLIALLNKDITLDQVPTVQVALKVTKEKTDPAVERVSATTRSEITAAKDDDGNQYGSYFTTGEQQNTDLDSTPGSIVDPQLDTYYASKMVGATDSRPAYFAGDEDDDDSETIYVGNRDTDPANLTVRYVDYMEAEDSPNRVLDTKEINGNVGDRYNETAKEFAGYQLIETGDNNESLLPTNSSGRLELDPIVITYYYKKVITVTTQYVEDSTGNSLKTEDAEDKLEGQNYTTSAADIDGYILIKDENNQPVIPANASGRAGDEKNQDGTVKRNITVTYRYIKVSQGVIEKHIDMKSDKVMYEDVHTGTVGTPYEITSREFAGYRLVETIPGGEGVEPISVLPDNATGVMTDEVIEVKYYYQKSATVRVQYHDENGVNLREGGDIIIEGYEGDVYETEAITFADYTLTETPSNASGTMTVQRDDDRNVTNTETVVTYVYRLSDSGGVIIRHVDIINDVVLSEEQKSGHIREAYTSRALTEVELPGYVYVESITVPVEDEQGNVSYEERDMRPINANGSMVKDTQIVTYYYRAKTTITVKYINQLDNSEIIPSVVYNGLEGNAKEILPQNIDGYVITDDSQKGIITYTTQRDENGLIIKDENDNIIGNNVNVVFYYRQIAGGVVEKHINIETNSIIYQEVHEGNVGTEYNIPARDFENMVLVEAVEQIVEPEDAEEGEEVGEDGKVHRIINMLPENSSGTMTEEAIEVVYYYRRGAKVRVKYIDVETNEPIPGVADTIIAGSENEPYETTVKVIDNYRLVETPANASGIMTVTENEDGTFNYETLVVYKYRSTYSAGLKIYYRDIVTNDLIMEDDAENPELISGANKRDEHYRIDPLQFYGYELVEEDEDGNSLLPENQEGTYEVEQQEMTFWYVRLTSVLVNYLEQGTNNELLDSDYIEGHENDKYITAPKDIDGYILVEKPLKDVGTMLVTKNNDGTYTTETVVNYYYAKVSGGVIEKHIDIKTDSILYNELHTGNVGDVYYIKDKAFTGYDLITIDEITGDPMTDNATGIMSENVIEVKYFYIRKAKAIAEYRDIDTKEKIFTDEVIDGHEGDHYKTTVETFDGYTLENVIGEPEGTMTVTVNDEDSTINVITKVVYEYKADVIPDPEPEPEPDPEPENNTVVNNEVINNVVIDNETIENTTTVNNVVENETIENTIVNETVENTTVENEVVNNVVENNTIVENEVVENTVVENVVENETVANTVTNTVNNTVENTVENTTGNTVVEEEAEEDDPTKSDGVLEKYIDINTDEVIEIVRHKGHIGDTYEITPKEIEGYDLVTTDKDGKTIMPTNTKGIMTKDAIEVVYYCVMKAYVRVQYYNKNSGKKIIDDVVIEGHEGDAYEIEEKEFDGYELVEKTDNYRGIFTVIDNKDGTFNKEIVVRFYYAKLNEEVLPATGEDIAKNMAYVLAFVANVTLAIVAFVKFRGKSRE